MNYNEWHREQIKKIYSIKSNEFKKIRSKLLKKLDNIINVYRGIEIIKNSKKQLHLLTNLENELENQKKKFETDFVVCLLKYS